MVLDGSSALFAANDFDRFASRQGIPHVNKQPWFEFTGYESELKTLSADKDVEAFLYEKDLLWKFTPIGAPHFNGYVELQIGILKSVMH